MSGVGYFSEQNFFGVIGSTLGILAPLLSIYIINLPGFVAYPILLTESFSCALWLSLQGIGIVKINERTRESVHIITFLLGFIGTFLEIVRVYWINYAAVTTDPLASWRALELLLSISILRNRIIGSYLIFLAVIMFKSSDNTYAKVAGFFFLIGAIFLFFYPQIGWVSTALANLIALFVFAGLGTVQSPVPRTKPHGQGIGLEGSEHFFP